MFKLILEYNTLKYDIKILKPRAARAQGPALALGPGPGPWAHGPIGPPIFQYILFILEYVIIFYIKSYIVDEFRRFLYKIILNRLF